MFKNVGVLTIFRLLPLLHFRCQKCHSSKKRPLLTVLEDGEKQDSM